MIDFGGWTVSALLNKRQYQDSDKATTIRLLNQPGNCNFVESWDPVPDLPKTRIVLTKSGTTDCFGASRKDIGSVLTVNRVLFLSGIKLTKHQSSQTSHLNSNRDSSQCSYMLLMHIWLKPKHSFPTFLLSDIPKQTNPRLHWMLLHRLSRETWIVL